MDKGPRAELLGSKDAEVPLGLQPVRSRLKLANRPFTTFSESFNPSAIRADNGRDSIANAVGALLG